MMAVRATTTPVTVLGRKMVGVRSEDEMINSGQKRNYYCRSPAAFEANCWCLI